MCSRKVKNQIKIKTKTKKFTKTNLSLSINAIGKGKTKSMIVNDHQNIHIPVLLDAVMQYLDPKPDESYLDLTAGYGGHARAVLQKTRNGPCVLVDRDQQAIKYLQNQFSGQNTQVLHKDFLTASQELQNEHREFDIILADVGVSSPHLNTASRGFSINLEGPLDMRMDQRTDLTAEKIVNSYNEGELVELLRKYGEEPASKNIARAIVGNRPISTTTQLANIIATAVHKRFGHSRIHPATRTFQALRIAVNRELDQLELGLNIWPQLLKPGGRLAVISFHSLEDRLVKRTFKDISQGGYDALFSLLTKRPISGEKIELVSNPRARSAKLRAVVKIKNKEGSFYADTGKKQLPSLQGKS